MAKYITAVEAARHLGVSERTVRLWIKSGKLDAHHVAKNRLAILVADVEVLRRKRQRYQDGKQDVSFLVARIDDLEKKCADLEQKYLELSSVIDEMRKNKPVGVPVPVSSEREVEMISDNLPPGCVWARDFAKQHGVNENSFRRHISSGIGGDMVGAEKCSKGRYLTLGQQRAALAFWERHKVKYHMSDVSVGNDLSDQVLPLGNDGMVADNETKKS